MFGECVRCWYSDGAEGGAREGAREVKEQPLRQLTRWRHPHRWPTATSSPPTLWPVFSSLMCGWRQGHLPVTSPGLQSQTIVSYRKTSDSFNKLIFWVLLTVQSPWLGFPVPFMLFANLSRRDQRGEFPSPLLISSPAQPESTPNSWERKYNWLILGQRRPLFWREVKEVQTPLLRGYLGGWGRLLLDKCGEWGQSRYFKGPLYIGALLR